MSGLRCLAVGVMTAASLALSPIGGALAGKPEGASLFDQECADCHSLQKRNKKGPTLAGIVGRKAGSIADFNGYSGAMAASAVIWSPASLDAYVKDPRAFMPGGKMRYDGLADAAARTAIIEYLAAPR